MIDQCQYCGHYGYLQRHGRVYLCGHCQRRHVKSSGRGEHQTQQETRHARARCDAR
jgi:hypothetical protein